MTGITLARLLSAKGLRILWYLALAAYLVGVASVLTTYDQIHGSSLAATIESSFFLREITSQLIQLLFLRALLELILVVKSGTESQISGTPTSE